jgi:hypothetical protein
VVLLPDARATSTSSPCRPFDKLRVVGSSRGADLQPGSPHLHRIRQRPASGDRIFLAGPVQLGGDGRAAPVRGVSLCRAQSRPCPVGGERRGLTLVKHPRADRGQGRSYRSGNPRDGTGRRLPRLSERGLRRSHNLRRAAQGRGLGPPGGLRGVAQGDGGEVRSSAAAR